MDWYRLSNCLQPTTREERELEDYVPGTGNDPRTAPCVTLRKGKVVRRCILADTCTRLRHSATLAFEPEENFHHKDNEEILYGGSANGDEPTWDIIYGDVRSVARAANCADAHWHPDNPGCSIRDYQGVEDEWYCAPQVFELRPDGVTYVDEAEESFWALDARQHVEGVTPILDDPRWFDDRNCTPLQREAECRNVMLFAGTFIPGEKHWQAYVCPDYVRDALFSHVCRRDAKVEDLMKAARTVRELARRPREVYPGVTFRTGDQMIEVPAITTAEIAALARNIKRSSMDEPQKAATLAELSTFAVAARKAQRRAQKALNEAIKTMNSTDGRTVNPEVYAQRARLRRCVGC